MPVGQKLDLILALQKPDYQPVRDALDATPAECTITYVADLDILGGLLERILPDLIFLALDLPGMEDRGRFSDLVSRNPSVPFVVLASPGEETAAREALMAGARDFVLRSELSGVTMARVLRYAGERRRVDSALETAARRYEAVLGAARDGLLIVDADGVIRDANANAEVMFGYGPGELDGRPVDELVPSTSEVDHEALRRSFMAGPVPRPMAAGKELRGRRADGTEFPAEIGLSPYTAGGSMFVFASVRDLTEAERLRRMSAAVAATDDLIITTDLSGTIETWNEAAARRFGRPQEEALGRPLRSFLAPEALEVLPDVLRRVRAGEHVHSVDNPDRDAEGREFHLALSFSPVFGRDGQPHATVVIGRDITRRKLLEADLERLAYYDPLTGLANRRLLHERLDYAIALARRQDHRVGVLYLDLGGFKEINDRLGHIAGDAVLVEVARRLSGAARDSDLVAREGGDEFVVLLSDVTDREAAVEAAHRILGAFRDPLTVNGETVTVDLQLGIALFPDHGSDAIALIDAADRAMYTRKTAARTGDPAASAPAVARVDTFERELTAALEENRLRLHFQPIVHANDDVVAGVEAFLRWEHPRRGLLSASEFISEAEELGMMPALDRWAVAEALRQARGRASAGAAPFWLSVNMSAQTLRRSEVVEWLSEIASREAISDGELRIDVKASDAFSSRVVRQTLEHIHALGVGITLDNYGAGDCPLVQLQEVPAWCLKVDRSLSARIDVPGNSNQLRFTRAAIELGRAAGMQVAVEGIERETQWQQLHGDGCDYLQGYYVGRPAPGDAIWN